MPIGISGDSILTLYNGLPQPDMDTIELRTISTLLQTLLGSSQAIDNLGTIRNDQAFELEIPTPLPGADR